MAKSNDMQIVLRVVDQTRRGIASAKRSIASVAQAALPYAAAAAAAGAAALKLASDLAAAAEAERVADARLGQVVRSMGLFGASADAVTKRVAAYSGQLAASIGVEDDSIKATQAKLMTFANLAKTAGEAGGMFDRATKAAYDLAAAGFGEAEKNAVQLGKALQDPVHGITALARAGVTFTESEKSRIKALVESGRLQEAQGVVMAAIEKQVGGVAAATATSGAKAKVAWEELKETLGAKLLPTFDSVKASVAETLSALAQGKAPEWLQPLLDKLKPLADALGAVFKKASAELSPALKELGASLQPVLKVLGAVAGVIGGVLVSAFGGIVGAISGVIRAFAGIVKAVTGFVTLVIGVLTGNKEKVRKGADMLLSGITGVFKGLWSAVSGFFSGFITTLLGVIGSWKERVAEKAKAIVDGIKQGIRDAWDGLVEWFSGRIKSLLGVFGRAIEARSPSRAFARMAAFIPAGVVAGIEGGLPKVRSAVASLSALSSFSPAAPMRPAFAASAPVSLKNDIRLVLDGRELERIIDARLARRDRTGRW